jgi:hypothetical protein
MNRKRIVLGLSIALGLPVFLLTLFLMFLDIQAPPQSSLSFDDLMAIEDMNETIRLSYHPYMTEQSEGKIYNLRLRNYSDSRVEFPVNYGVRMFITTGVQERWVEIKNDMNYYAPTQGGNPILAVKGSDIPFMGISTIPVIPNHSEPVTLRIIVTGNVLSFISTPGKLVGAYVDIIVQP